MEGPIGGCAGATPRASRSAEREKPEKEKQNLSPAEPLFETPENPIHAKTNAPKNSRRPRAAPPSRLPAIGARIEAVMRGCDVAGTARPVRFSFAISVSLPGFV